MAFRYHALTLNAAPLWKQSQQADKSMLVLLGPKHGGFQSNVVVTLDADPDADAKRFAAARLAEVGSAVRVSKEGPATFGKLSGWLREQRLTQSGHELGQLQFFV